MILSIIGLIIGILIFIAGLYYFVKEKMIWTQEKYMA